MGPRGAILYGAGTCSETTGVICLLEALCCWAPSPGYAELCLVCVNALKQTSGFTPLLHLYIPLAGLGFGVSQTHLSLFWLLTDSQGPCGSWDSSDTGMPPAKLSSLGYASNPRE